MSDERRIGVARDDAEPRKLGIGREYDDVILLCKLRMAELDITFAELDHVSGVQPGYSAKVIGPCPWTVLGPVSWGKIMAALCIKWVAYDDPKAMEKMRAKLTKRRRPAREQRIGSIPWLFTPLSAEQANVLRKAKVPAWKRRQIARKAARARWRRVKSMPDVLDQRLAIAAPSAK